jgi:hypothetical protein
MSVKITKEIQAAIRQMVEEYGSAVEVERKTQITNSNISKYLSGKLLKMNDSTWQVLEPHLRPYLPMVGAKNIGIQTGNGGNYTGNAHTVIQGGGGVNTIPANDLVEQFRQAALNGIIDLDIDPVAQAAVLKFLKNLRLKK